MLLTNTLLAALAAVGASAQRRRPPPDDPEPEPTPAPPPPALGETQTMWGQCGGRDWEYATDCPAGASCYNDGENEWYSQCIPAEDAEELAQNPDVNIETQIITTRFDVPGPTPSVVTTYITVYTPAPNPDTPEQQPQPQPDPQPPVVTAVPDTPINGRKRRRDT